MFTPSLETNQKKIMKNSQNQLLHFFKVLHIDILQS